MIINHHDEEKFLYPLHLPLTYTGGIYPLHIPLEWMDMSKHIPIPLTNDEVRLLEELKKSFATRYKVGKYAVHALYVLTKLGFRWYHIKMLSVMCHDRTSLDFKEDIIDHLKGVINFLDTILETMLKENQRDLKIFFTDREIKELMAYAKEK